jgi:hypothetical protein
MSAHLTIPESVSYRWIRIGRLAFIVFLSTGGSSPASRDDYSTARATRRGSRARRRRAGSAAVRLLLRFPAAVCLQVVERGGAPLVQYHSGEAGDGELGQTRLSDDVWEIAGDWVSCSV